MKKIFGGGGEKKQHHQRPAQQANVDFNREIRGQIVRCNLHTVSIEGRLAEGGFALVYLVKDVKNGRYYALKKQFVNDPKMLDACKREIQIIKTLAGHPNIVCYVDSEVKPMREEGVYECQMLTKFYKRTILQKMNDHLQRGTHFTEPEILKIFCDVCDAIARLHHAQTPILHRDLKVENILIDDDGTYVLCDFGSATNRVYNTKDYPIAQVDEEINKYTTLSYRAPEMVDLYSGRPITTKSDIWALGVMLYKLCYFQLPFKESPLAIQNGAFAFPEYPVYSEALAALIRYLLEPDMDRRPDIYQVSSVACKLFGRRCSVGNLNKVGVPTIDQLIAGHFIVQPPLPAGAAARPSSRPTAQSPHVDYGNDSIIVSPSETTNVTTPRMTTVAPRERPRAAQKTSVPLLQPTKVPESQSNPDLTGRNVEIPTSRSVHSGIQKAAVESMPRPEELGFTELEPPLLLPQQAQHPSQQQAAPVQQQHPMITVTPERLYGTLPRGIGATTTSEAPSHRRYGSDTTAAIIFGDRSRPSAFKAYSKDQLATDAPAQAPVDDVTYPYSHHQSFSGAIEVPGGAPVGPPAAAAEYRTHSAADVHHLELNWNPFKMPSQGAATAGACGDMNDVEFAASFDRLPRRNSASSTSNVKSRESLVMDDVDPFGQAPFNPSKRTPRSQQNGLPADKTAAVKSPSNEKAKTAEAKQTPKPEENNIASPMREVPKYYGSYGHVKLEQSDDDSGPDEHRKKAPQKLPPKDPLEGVLAGAGPEALTTLTNSLSKQSRYKKLVDDDEDLLDLGQPKTPRKDEDDLDSIGNADDLKNRMGDTSSDESGDHDQSSAGADFDNDDRPPSDFDALDGASPGGHPYYEHFLDPHSNPLNEAGGSSSEAGTTGDPMTTLEDRLAHQTLLDDDELAEGQFSLPKSLEFPGLESVPVAAHGEVASPESADTLVISPRDEEDLTQPLHQQVEKLEPTLMQDPPEVFRSAPFPIPLKQRIHAPPPGTARAAPVTIPLQPKCAPPSKTPSPPDLVDFEEDGDEETSFAGKPASRSSSRASSSGAKRIPAKLKMKLERPVPPVKEPPPAVPPKTRKLKSGSKKVEVTSFVNNSFQVEVED